MMSHMENYGYLLLSIRHFMLGIYRSICDSLNIRVDTSFLTNIVNFVP